MSVQQSLDGGSVEQHECPKCGREFKTENAMKTHYGFKHEGSIAGVEVECEWCGRTRRIKRKNKENAENHFCKDRDCRGKWVSENNSGNDNPNYNSVMTECGYCGNPLERSQYYIERSENHFCNSTHRGLYRSEQETFAGEKNPAWVEGNTEDVECPYCGDMNERPIWEIETNERCFCDKYCYSDWRSENIVGENHPSWEGGRNEIYYQIRDKIDKRSWRQIRQKHTEENDICQLCGEKDEGNLGLHTHHIIPVMCGGTNDEYNRMSLCGSCHIVAEHYTRSFTESILKYGMRRPES